MNGTRAQNPSGNAAPPPAAGQNSSQSAGSGSSKSKYQQQCEADNPEPADEQKGKPKVSLSNCRFETPVEELRLNEEFEFAVDVKKIGDPKTRRAYFDLYCTRTRGGKEDRARIWAHKEAMPKDDKADPMVVAAKGFLDTESDYKLGEPVKFELECSHQEADEVCKSKPVEIKLMTRAFWIGGDDLFFRNDGELPLLREDGSLIQVLVSAIQRVEKPPPKSTETTVCFGFASAAGNPDPNRKLSLRRAQVVKAILDRDSGAWNDLAKANFETQDMQQFLSDLHKACGWECDPGAVDGQAGPKTRSAIESFQHECNARYKLALKEDGVAGPKTWSAVLRVIWGQIQDALGQDPTKEPSWKKPRWGNGGKGVYACGEDYATDGDKPEERSVQITFFPSGSEPALEDVADGQKPTPTDNPVQDGKLVTKEKIGIPPSRVNQRLIFDEQICLIDAVSGQPVSDCPYVIYIDNSIADKGRTDSSGHTRRIESGSSEAELTIFWGDAALVRS